MKRLFDIVISLVVLVAVSPLLLISAAAIRLTSPGPILYRAIRVGRNGEHFEMLKFRSMHVSSGGAVITSSGDARIFPVGRLLRRSKLDELPQFINVLEGRMSIVGPRPEDPKIVDQFYTPWMRETLKVRPGITSPGAIFYYACGEKMIDDGDPERSYVENFLPPKLAVERAYLDRATLGSDVVVVLRTAAAILGDAIGRPVFPSTHDLSAATAWVPASAFGAMTKSA